MAKISIIIVTYNSQADIGECLDSVLKQDFLDYEIIVIDNASKDGSLDIIKKYSGRLKLKVNGRNIGFPGALNIGIGLAEGEYIFTLNPDVVLEHNFLLKLSKHIEKFDKKVGMLGVKILKRGQEGIIDSTGLVLSNAIRFFDRGQGEKDTGQYDNMHEILGPCAAAGIYKKSMLEDIKIGNEYFDKDFFYLIEDFDIALRAERRGWKGAYLPDEVCYHKRNGSSNSYRYRQYMSFRNRYLLMMKNMEMKPLLITYFFIYDMTRLLFMLLLNRSTIRAIMEIKQLIPVMIEKRKAVMEGRKVLGWV